MKKKKHCNQKYTGDNFFEFQNSTKLNVVEESNIKNTKELIIMGNGVINGEATENKSTKNLVEDIYLVKSEKVFKKKKI